MIKELIHAVSSTVAAQTAKSGNGVSQSATPTTDIADTKKIELAQQTLAAVVKSSQIFGNEWFNDNGVPKGTSYAAGGNSVFQQLPFRELRVLSHMSDLVRMCISICQNQISGLEWYLDTDDSSPVDPAADDLLNRPDGIRSWAVWSREILEDSLTIDQVVLLPWIKNNKVISVEIMDGADWILLERLSSDQRVPSDKKVYQQISSGEKFSREEIWFYQRNTRSYSLRGYSGVEQVHYRAMTNFWSVIRGLQKWTVEGLDKVLVGTPDSMTEVHQVNDHQKRLNTEVKRKQRFVNIPGDPKLVIPKVPDIDAADAELLIRFICAVFGIDPTVLVSKVNYNTADVLERWALLAGMSPMLTFLQSIANKILIESGFAGHKFQWLIEKEAKHKQLIIKEMENWKNGTRSWQEMRVLQGDTPDPKDLQDHTWVILLGASKNFDPETGIEQLSVGRAASELLEGSEVKKSISSKVKKSIPSVIEKSEQKKAVASGIKLWLSALEEGSKKYKAEALQYAVTQSVDIEKAAVAELVDDGFADVKLFEELVTWDQLLHDAGITEAEGLLDSMVNLVPEVEQSALEIVGNLIGKKLVDGKLINNPNAKWRLSDETLGQINTYLDTAIDKGLGVDEIESGIDAIIDNPARAGVIARTEAARAYNIGTALTYEAIGINEVEISDNEGPNSCVECEAANGQVWTVKKFMANPLEHTNCVRTAFPAVEGDK